MLILWSDMNDTNRAGGTSKGDPIDCDMADNKVGEKRAVSNLAAANAVDASQEVDPHQGDWVGSVCSRRVDDRCWAAPRWVCWGDWVYSKQEDDHCRAIQTRDGWACSKQEACHCLGDWRWAG
ncbi:hypothetical protein A8B75_12185 [Sphingomonadales bacterium EhC05]|nr:hypothetical protein A8B75_12185 [Sphingomonadales bacterium EhC05]